MLGFPLIKGSCVLFFSVAPRSKDPKRDRREEGRKKGLQNKMLLQKHKTSTNCPNYPNCYISPDFVHGNKHRHYIYYYYQDNSKSLLEGYLDLNNIFHCTVLGGGLGKIHKSTFLLNLGVDDPNLFCYCTIRYPHNSVLSHSFVFENINIIYKKEDGCIQKEKYNKYLERTTTTRKTESDDWGLVTSSSPYSKEMIVLDDIFVQQTDCLSSSSGHERTKWMNELLSILNYRIQQQVPSSVKISIEYFKSESFLSGMQAVIFHAKIEEYILDFISLYNFLYYEFNEYYMKKGNGYNMELNLTITPKAVKELIYVLNNFLDPVYNNNSYSTSVCVGYEQDAEFTMHNNYTQQNDDDGEEEPLWVTELLYALKRIEELSPCCTFAHMASLKYFRSDKFLTSMNTTLMYAHQKDFVSNLVSLHHFLNFQFDEFYSRCGKWDAWVYLTITPLAVHDLLQTLQLYFNDYYHIDF